MDEKEPIDRSKEDEDEDMAGFTDAMLKFREELPYNKRRYIMIIGFSILVLLVVYLGYAYGGLKMCTQVGGILDNTYTCQLGFASPSNNFDKVGQRFIVPNVIINSSGDIQ